MQVLKKQLGIEDHTNKNSTYEYIPNPDKQASIFSQPKIRKMSNSNKLDSYTI